MSKGVMFGFQYLEEGEYEIRGGLGNSALSELEVKDGKLYFKGEKDEIVPPTINEFLNESF